MADMFAWPVFPFFSAFTLTRGGKNLYFCRNNPFWGFHEFSELSAYFFII